MSIFNVGTGREPAEIGVAEYQKPDYQQFEKLANVNMQMKQAELEKAQKKTKEWGDILNTDFSTKYAIEQANVIKDGKQKIMDDLLKDMQGNPHLLNDPVTMMTVKARFNQLAGKVKAFDIQADNIFKTVNEVNNDPKGIKYDRAYATDFLKAQDDPIGYYNSNKDSEVGKTLGGIINSPEIQAITDPIDKRSAVRSALQATPLKKGTINIPRVIQGNPKNDVSVTYIKGTERGKYEAVTPVAAMSFAMNGHASGANENIPFRDYTKTQIIKENGAENYQNYLSTLKDDYSNFYNNAKTEYKDRPITMGILENKMPTPDKITENELLDYSWAKNKYTDYVTEDKTQIPVNSVNVNVGDGNKTKTTV